MKVFISHTAKDKNIADELAKQLYKRGIYTYFD